MIKAYRVINKLSISYRYSGDKIGRFDLSKEDLLIIDEDDYWVKEKCDSSYSGYSYFNYPVLKKIIFTNSKLVKKDNDIICESYIDEEIINIVNPLLNLQVYNLTLRDMSVKIAEEKGFIEVAVDYNRDIKLEKLLNFK